MTEFARLAAPGGCRSDIRTLSEFRRSAGLNCAVCVSSPRWLLVLMAVIFLAMRRAPPNWIWAPYRGAFAEAGMVGACTDWFAVVALLRRPLGLPIRHTAVVPENKRRIGAAVGRFITNNFLARRHRAAYVGRLCESCCAMARGRAQRAGGRGRRRTHHSVRARPRAERSDRRMGGFCHAARGRGGARGTVRLPRTLYPVGAGSGADAARSGPQFR